MILELNGTKVTIVDKTLGYQGDNLVDTIQVTVDKDSTWNYKLDMYKGKSKCFDSVLMTREGNICTVQLTNEILSYGGRYVFQLRGYTDTQIYHSNIFESWVNASIEYQDDCKQTDCGCDCKLPTEFYQVEDNVTEINNHPPYPGDNNKWMIWDVNKHQYVESDIDVIGGGGEDYQTKANLTTLITAESTDQQYPSAKATYDAIEEAKTNIIDENLTEAGKAADAAAVGERLSKLSEEKVSLPKAEDGSVIPGTAGWYAVSDGAGGITWVESAPSTGGGGETTTHGIVWDLVNVTSSNNAVSVADGASLVAVLTPADGYSLGDVTITMGGEVVTGAWNAETATITIEAVTVDVVISCAGVEQGTGEVIDTSPVIAHSGYAYRSVSTTSSNVTLTAKNGMCVTKIYEFTPNVAAIEAHPSYDADLGYINFANQIGMFTSFLPNQKYLESGATDPGNTYKKSAYFVDGELQKTIYDNLTTQSAEGTSASGLARNVLQKSVNGIAFTLFEADAEDSYAYWTKTNSSGTYQENAVLPVGVNDGDIIFAGKNTPYYGMTNINGATGGGDASVSELSFDDDVAQNYAVASASILGEDTAADPKTEYGISAELAAVIDEVRTAWMTEYGGDYRKIPLIITTDQHGRTNSGIFNMLGKTLSFHDVSKIMNLGDTVSVEWYDEDTTKPLVSCAQLEKWCESIKEIPFSKRLDVYGNHDTWYGNYDDEGNTIGTRYPANQSHLDQYFRNIYARRNNNNGWFVIRDDYFNVKYVVISGFEYQGGVTFRIGAKQMNWMIDEMGKDDGYDIVIVSHVPLYYQDSTNIWPTGMVSSTPDSTEIMRVASIDTDALFNARKNRTNGTVTDSDGVEHAFDFTDCTTDILCGLHGHVHIDGYNYVGGAEDGLMNAAFDWFDENTMHFVLIDRVNRMLNIWKLEGDALTYQNYQVPLDKISE